MLRLPVCPHCHAVYSYKEVNEMKQGARLCYHCNKKFMADKKFGRFIFLPAVCLILILINVMIFISTDSFSIVIMLADLVIVTAAVMLMPLTVRFKPEKMTKSEKRKLRSEEQEKDT